MKKKPASVPEIPKTTAKSERPGAGRLAKPAPTPAAPELETPKTKRAPRKPLLEVAVETVKKMLKPKPAAAKPAPLAEDPKRAAGKKPAVEEPKVEVDATTLVRRTYTRKKKIEVPLILLEGDAPRRRPSAAPAKNFRSEPRRPRKSLPAANCRKATAPGNCFSPLATRTGFTQTGI